MENGNYLKDIVEEIWVKYFRDCVSFTFIQKFLQSLPYIQAQEYYILLSSVH